MAGFGGFSVQPVNWPTSPDLIAQTAYDLGSLHNHRETQYHPNRHHNPETNDLSFDRICEECCSSFRRTLA